MPYERNERMELVQHLGRLSQLGLICVQTTITARHPITADNASKSMPVMRNFDFLCKLLAYEDMATGSIILVGGRQSLLPEPVRSLC